jgi:YbbR domain-containing protein
MNDRAVKAPAKARIPRRDKGRQRKSWIENNKYLMIFSVCVAAVVWLVVLLTVGSDNFKSTFSSVPVNVEMKAPEFAALNLNAIEVANASVSATVSGDRVAISGMVAQELEATVVLPTDITEPGKYSLRLVPANADYDKSLYKSIVYDPPAVMVSLDTLVNKTIPITPVVNGISFMPGYVQGNQVVTPAQVTLRGPKAVMDLIERCVIEAEMIDALDGPFVEDYPVKVLDSKGEELDLEANPVTINYDEARLVIEALKIARLRLRLLLTNVPKGFPEDQLRYFMSNEFIEVEVPADTVAESTEIMVGYLDMRTIDKDNDAFTFPVELPDNYENRDTFNRITVRFNSATWEEAVFTASGIELLNVPDRYNVEIQGDVLYNITMVGRKDILDTMTAEDIVMEMDLSEIELTEGQHRRPVKISAPTKGLVWASGTDYSAIIEVTEKEQASE